MSADNFDPEAAEEHFVMEPEYFWVAKDHRRVLIEKMDDLHLMNTIRYLCRHGYEQHAAVQNGKASEIEKVEARLVRIDPMTYARYCNMVDELACREKAREEAAEQRRNEELQGVLYPADGGRDPHT
jgi:hypothetical protein